jgi:hypothetical protein
VYVFLFWWHIFFFVLIHCVRILIAVSAPPEAFYIMAGGAESRLDEKSTIFHLSSATSVPFSDPHFEPPSTVTTWNRLKETAGMEILRAESSRH